jgi:hypothetical protein
MTERKIQQVVAMYRARLRHHGIPEIRMDPKRTFKELTTEEALAHAHFLLKGVEAYAEDRREGKCGRHLGAVQMILSFAGWYTLEDLMQHNRPDAGD